MFTGTVAQSQVEALAPHLSKDNNGGRVLAEELLRSDSTRGPLVGLFDGDKLKKEEERFLPVSVITGQRITAADLGVGGGD